ncbi:glycosyltransferase family 2 protein [Aureliella helgolandensis]|uniref:Undecaprenyl-phosphate 4-deoxy-4-formamido-L-arabinose transferase n=1 Tax=Aureliella helgolandensis TaxID=2527968 RepID=A0A518G805_9BACT|nr:glycosyltransferase family 2 protein [Aureliella helgolandensis]QDV24726.1 Undecaprenyl-phosphate 4-deoxy-4-formamido-L-arabinose transferase [Aureliella helgolandensis]
MDTLETNVQRKTRLPSSDSVEVVPKRLAVIVPCYNEAESIQQLSKKLGILAESAAQSFQLELILVDDGSSDTTHGMLCDHFRANEHVRVVRHATNQGIAAAIATGIGATDSPILASIDADCTYDPLLVLAMADLLTEEVDMVVASPYHPGGRVEGVPAWRLQLSRCASRLYGLVLHNKLHTYTSCVRVYRRSAVQRYAVREPGFVGIVELLWAVDAAGGKIVECPAILTVRSFGVSKMKVSSTTYKHVKFLSRILLRRMLPKALLASPKN